MSTFSVQRTGIPGVRCGRQILFPEAEIPYAIVEGAYPGPCLAITAGVHGSEYSSIQAAIEMMDTDPAELSGTIIVFPQVNVSGFSARSIYIMPEDGKNLNRQFPGRSGGTYSERLAHWLLNTVICQADAYIDLHGGDMSEELTPVTIYTNGHSHSRMLAQYFGLPIIVASSTTGSTIGAANARGVPSILAEVGGNGRWTRSDVDALKDGVRRVMRHLHMVDVAPPGEMAPRSMRLSAPVARDTGLWYPEKALGDPVAVGDLLGTIRDVFGREIGTEFSEVGGSVLYRLTTLSVNKGEQLMGIGVELVE